MKNAFIGVAAIIISLVSCKSGSNTSEDKKSNDTSHTTAVKQIASGSSFKDIITHYLHVKNALTKDDGKETANGGKALTEAFAKFDQSSLSSVQKKIYADIVEDAKEHAEHIGMNADKVAHQREHFSSLSKDVYDLVKTFGSGQTLYQDFCPMYNNNKGATWLSETKEINNPYLGKKMPTCGQVKEEIK